jgi:hypothetical protein
MDLEQSRRVVNGIGHSRDFNAQDDKEECFETIA